MVFRLIEIRGRLDSETVCTAEGIEDDYVVCSNDIWTYIASIKETANNPVVNAGRRCLNGIRAGTEEPLFELDCDAGLIERRDSSGTRQCYSSPECGSSLVARYVSESDRYVCSETEETASQFWEYAFHSRGIQGDYQKARWIGGLGSAYMKLTWTDSEWGLREWRFMSQASAEEHMLRIGTGKSHLYICYEHDCAKAGNLLGSTDFNVSGCHAFVWQTEEGLWFLMRIEESVPVCVRAFGKVVSGEINGASAGYSSSSKDTGRTVPKDDIERPVYYEYYVEFKEITLSQSSKNESPVDNNTWVAAIDLRE